MLPRLLLLVPLLLAGHALADTLDCSSDVPDTKRSGVLGTDGGQVHYTVCSAYSGAERHEGALWASLGKGKARQLVQTMGDGPVDQWRLTLGGGWLLLDFPCEAVESPDGAFCVRRWEVRDGDFVEDTARVLTRWEVGAQRIEMLLAADDVEAARGVAMRLGPPPRHIVGGEDRIFLAFLQNAWFRARAHREAGDLRSATEAMMALLAQPPVLSGSSQMFPDKITLRPGYGAYSIPGQLQIDATPLVVERLVDGAAILSEGGERRRASDILTEVVRVVPETTQAWLILGDVYWSQRLKHQAQQAYRRYQELSGESGPEYVTERLAE